MCTFIITERVLFNQSPVELLYFLKQILIKRKEWQRKTIWLCYFSSSSFICNWSQYNTPITLGSCSSFDLWNSKYSSRVVKKYSRSIVIHLYCWLTRSPNTLSGSTFLSFVPLLGTFFQDVLSLINIQDFGFPPFSLYSGILSGRNS